MLYNTSEEQMSYAYGTSFCNFRLVPAGGITPSGRLVVMNTVG